MSIKEYDYYLFDFDGTLYDTRESLIPVFKYAFKCVGYDMKDDEVDIYMHADLKTIAKNKNMSEEQKKLFVDGIDIALDDEESLKLIKPFADVPKMLKFLKDNNKKIGIISSNSEKHIGDVLRILGVENCYDCIIGNESYTHHKPHAEPILKALEKLKVKDYSRAVYIGDSPRDVESGRAANIDSILIDRPNLWADFDAKRVKNLEELIIIS